MKCSYQPVYKFDQSDYKLKVVVKQGDQYLSRERCAFPARTTPDQSFNEDEHKVLCGTEMTTNAPSSNSRLRWRSWQWEVAKLFAQVSHQVDNRSLLFVEVKKLIQDLILESTAEISQKG